MPATAIADAADPVTNVDRSPVDARRTVGLLPQDVGVADVASRLLHDVNVDPAQRHLPQAGMRHRVIEVGPDRGAPRLLARLLVLGDQRPDRLVVEDANCPRPLPMAAQISSAGRCARPPG